MAEKVAIVRAKREDGYLYFIDKEGDISRAKMASGGKRGGRPQKVTKVGVRKVEGYLYFMDKQGDISRAKMVSSPREKRPRRQGPEREWVPMDSDLPGKREVAASHGDPEAIAQKTERANKLHQRLLHELQQSLKRAGWREFKKISGVVDMRAVRNHREVFIEAKTINDRNENHQIRAGLGQLLEYRFERGSPQIGLCLVVNRQPAPRRIDFLSSLKIGICWFAQGKPRGNQIAKRLLGEIIK